MKKSTLAITVIFVVLALDQALKIWVKTHFLYDEEIPILGQSWAKINFVENPGMAFGWELGGNYGKLFLSLFRIIAIGLLIFYIHKLVRSDAKSGLIVSLSLILAGAMGNIIDSAFYGLIFNNALYNTPAQLFPPNGGYGTFLHGRVVDMLFFPLWKNALGEVKFFQYVFNIADVAVTLGVASLVFFNRQFLTNSDKNEVEQLPKNDDSEQIES